MTMTKRNEAMTNDHFTYEPQRASFCAPGVIPACFQRESSRLAKQELPSVALDARLRHSGMTSYASPRRTKITAVVSSGAPIQIANQPTKIGINHAPSVRTANKPAGPSVSNDDCKP